MQPAAIKFHATPPQRLSSPFLIPVVAIALAFIAFVPRFVALDAKPPMHDESMFAYYAWQGMQPNAFGVPPHYQHQAILHGPVQMLGIIQFFKLFGDSQGSARAFIACCSIAMLAAGLWLSPRRWRWWFAPLWFTSPIALYYSRYLHEELIFNGAFLIGMLGLARGTRRNWTGTLGLLLALGALLLMIARAGLLRPVAEAQLAGLSKLLAWHRGELSTLLALVLLAAGAVCGVYAVPRAISAALWAILGAVGLFFPLAVKESCLFVYAAGFTFLLLWVAIELFWRRPAPGLGWLPRRRSPHLPDVKSTAATKPPKAQRGGKRPAPDAEPPQGRGLEYMHRTFDQVVGAGALAPAHPDAAAAASTAGSVPGVPDPIAARRRARLLAFSVVFLWTFGLLLGAWIVCWIYGMTRPDSAPTWGFRQVFYGATQNMLDSWNYWMEQHKLNRMGGAVDYYFPILITYELPIFLLMWAGFAWDATRRRGRLAFYVASFSLWLLVYWVYCFAVTHITRIDPAMAPEAVASILASDGLVFKFIRFLHLDPVGSNDFAPQAQFFIIGSVFVPMLTWSILCLKQHRVLAAWFGWWAACSLFQYSTAGEKVPWLAVNIIVPIYFTLIWVWAPHIKRLAGWGRWTLAACTLVAALIALRTDFYLVWPNPTDSTTLTRGAADPRERIVYNHTTPVLDELCRAMLKDWKTSAATIPLKQRRILLLGGPGWPGVWYFRDCSVTTLEAPLTSIDPSYDLIIGDQAKIDPVLPNLDLNQWVPRAMSLRDHWLVHGLPFSPIPNEKGEVSFKQWCAYYASAKPWRAWWNYYWFRETWEPEPGHFPVIALIPQRGRH